jgi:hypothetical protein
MLLIELVDSATLPSLFAELDLASTPFGMTTSSTITTSSSMGGITTSGTGTVTGNRDTNLMTWLASRSSSPPVRYYIVHCEAVTMTLPNPLHGSSSTTLTTSALLATSTPASSSTSSRTSTSNVNTPSASPMSSIIPNTPGTPYTPMSPHSPAIRTPSAGGGNTSGNPSSTRKKGSGPSTVQQQRRIGSGVLTVWSCHEITIEQVIASLTESSSMSSISPIPSSLPIESKGSMDQKWNPPSPLQLDNRSSLWNEYQLASVLRFCERHIPVPSTRFFKFSLFLFSSSHMT